jgi:hypothetical protein
MVGVGEGGACVRQMAKWIGIRSPPPLPPPSPARRMESSNGTSGADKLIETEHDSGLWVGSFVGLSGGGFCC